MMSGDEQTKAAADLAKYLPIEQAYRDVAQGPAKEVGKVLTDVIKTGRLILAPLQILAAFQDRFERYAKRIADKVPEDRRIEVRPMISGPVLELLRYVDEGEPLAEFMLGTSRVRYGF
jgi:hypothetical protein